MSRPSADEMFEHSVTEQGTLKFMVTLPVAMGRRLEQEAASQHRTTSNFLLHMVGLYFEAIDQEPDC